MSLPSCINFNIAHYSKNITGINTKPGILAHHDQVQLQDKGHNSESYISGVMPFLIKFLSRMIAPPWQTSVGTACGVLVLNVGGKPVRYPITVRIQVYNVIQSFDIALHCMYTWWNDQMFLDIYSPNYISLNVSSLPPWIPIALDYRLYHISI